MVCIGSDVLACVQDKEKELQKKEQELETKRRELTDAHEQRAALEAELAKLRGESLKECSDKELETIRAAQEQGLQRVKDEEERRDVENFVASENPDFVCPVSRALMKDPVVALDGYTYERAYIEEWIQKYSGDTLRSPRTNLPLPSPDLFPVRSMQSGIEWAVEREVLQRKRAREAAHDDGGSAAKRPKVATET